MSFFRGLVDACRWAARRGGLSGDVELACNIICEALAETDARTRTGDPFIYGAAGHCGSFAGLAG